MLLDDVKEGNASWCHGEQNSLQATGMNLLNFRARRKQYFVLHRDELYLPKELGGQGDPSLKTFSFSFENLSHVERESMPTRHGALVTPSIKTEHNRGKPSMAVKYLSYP